MDTLLDGRYQLLDTVVLPNRPARYSPIPKSLHPVVAQRLSGQHKKLYHHQTEALEAFLSGADVCLATSTASGKSLVFMSAASDLLLREPLAKCLVLYPAKALIMDQLQRWKNWSEQLGLKVGYIHGDVSGEVRYGILLTSHIVLMTPDVAHAWMMSHLGDTRIGHFLRHLRILVLDEAHVYEGAFGSNMAFFMRRFRHCAPDARMVLTTATLGNPEEFAFNLTGRRVKGFGREDDGAETPAKTIAVISEIDADTFQAKVDLLQRLKEGKHGRFIAFADSRRMVEQLTVAASVGFSRDDGEASVDEVEQDLVSQAGAILPYRAGYEDHDRGLIQRALTSGKLAGVVSTSALELGLDIGELDLVVLFGVPPTLKSFWQRAGRAGRRRPGTCLIVDSAGLIASMFGGLSRYLERALEPNWLYLENRRIQYVNALCAAAELGETDPEQVDWRAFEGLPTTFTEYLRNEINPTASVDSDLLDLKQRGQSTPHYEFPIRNALELNFAIKNGGVPMGSVSMSQALREAYPGALYYYMARPYRVKLFNVKNREIHVSPEKRWTTRPIARTKVFPDFFNGIYALWRSEAGFIAECRVQVSEQVLGFKEKRGKTETEYTYGPGAQFYHRPLNRFFSTSGVCWRFPDDDVCSASIGEAMLQAFSAKCGIDTRDISCGAFHAKASPFAEVPIQGVTIYDSTDGSLRLTQKLAENFKEVTEAAIALCLAEDSSIRCSHASLSRLLEYAEGVVEAGSPTVRGTTEAQDSWVTVIARDEPAVYQSDGANLQVRIIHYVYTPAGLKYHVKLSDSKPACIVHADYIQPLHGESRLLRVNFETGEEEALYSE